MKAKEEEGEKVKITNGGQSKNRYDEGEEYSWIVIKKKNKNGSL